MELYFSQLSPFVRLVRVAAIELGLDDRITPTDTPVTPADRNDSYAQLMPLRQVPALKLDDGTVLHDSTLILLWLDETGGGRLLAKGDARWPMLATYKLAHGVMEAAVNLRYEQVVRPEPLRWSTWIDDRLDKIRTTVAALEAQATPPADVLDMAQVGLACMLGYLDFRFPELAWRERHPKLDAWYAEVSKRPSLQATVPPAQ